MSPPVRPEQDPYGDLGQAPASSGGTDPYAGLGAASQAPVGLPAMLARMRGTPMPGVRPDITAALPTTPKAYAQAANLPERAFQQLGEFGEGAVRHPIATAEGLVTAPIQSAYRTFAVPVQGETVPLNAKTGRSNNPLLPAGTVITRANSPEAITPQSISMSSSIAR